MSVKHLTFWVRLLTTIAVVVSLNTFSFAHQQAGPQVTPELQAYLDNGGTLEDICGMYGTPETEEHADCPACRLVDGAVSMRAPDCARSSDLISVLAWSSRTVANATRPAFAQHQPRAPPFDL